MRGRPAKPTVIKLLTGNPGRRPLNPSEARPPAGVPEAPDFLTAEAKREWARIVPLLAQSGLITTLDRGVMANYCEAWSRWVACQKKIRREGFIRLSCEGVPCYTRHYEAANKAMDQIRHLGEQLGLSPSARSRIRTHQPPLHTDPAEKFLNGDGEAAA